ncbi:hypothetical protein ABG067_007870, partial [Albugo candida]
MDVKPERSIVPWEQLKFDRELDSTMFPNALRMKGWPADVEYKSIGKLGIDD